MIKTDKLSIVILLIGFILTIVKAVYAIEASELNNKVAFIRNGDVWIVDLSGKKLVV